MNVSWTDAELDTLKTMWVDGHSATQIAKAMGSVTRSAVLGKIKRLKDSGDFEVRERKVNPTLGAPTKISKPAPKPTPKPAPKPKAPLLPASEFPTEGNVDGMLKPVSFDKGLIELERLDCRWIVSGEGESAFFCANAQTAGSSYCEYHRRASIGRGSRSERNALKVPKVFL